LDGLPPLRFLFLRLFPHLYPTLKLERPLHEYSLVVLLLFPFDLLIELMISIVKALFDILDHFQVGLSVFEVS
jgi:hypothetical protein